MQDDNPILGNLLRTPKNIRIKMLTTSELLEYDRRHLWHPYTSMVDPLPTYPVASCHGVRIVLEDGRELIDGMSSWWSAVHGYNHPRLNAAISEQVERMSHVMFGGLTHRPAVELARRLTRLLPAGLDRVFMADSGSIAIEVALKMALQWQISQGAAQRCEFLTIRGGYHGDTWHAMSVCDPDGGMHSLWSGRLTIQNFVPRPTVPFGAEWNPTDLEPMREAFAECGDRLAAVVLEPIVQGAGGMWFYHPSYLEGVARLCRENGVLLIVDEIATGFGRTGRMFATEWAEGVTPDIMCVGKALTGGYMTLAATVATERVALGIDGAFMHGPTFMGNPLAAAVACASLDLLIEQSPLERIASISSLLEAGLAPLRGAYGVADVRVLGAIGVVELDRDVDMRTLQAAFVERGVWVRPFGRLVYIMPPYVISDDDLATLCRAVVEVAGECR